jgi:uncharacterized protein Yka (UPF0111/DUF47 family)
MHRGLVDGRDYGAGWMRLARHRPDPTLLDLFDESGRNVQHAAELLRDILSECPEQNGLTEELYRCEQEGDRIVHDILHRLASRGSKRAHLDTMDVHALAGALDDIVDLAEEAANQLALYGVEAPMAQAEEMADVLVAATKQVALSLYELRNGGELAANLVEIHRLENDGDRLVQTAVASLFATGIDPMMVIRWKDIFDTLEGAVDACERVANVLEGMCLKAGRLP